MALIDIGSAAIGRAVSSTTNTYIGKENPANASGKITSIEIYAVSGQDLVNCEVAIFFVVSGDNLSTRDTHTIGAVVGGSKQTFTGLDLEVQTGDYIGIYFSSGELERDSSGTGYWWFNGDAIPADNVEFAFVADRTMSVYGTGTTEVGNAIFFGSNF